MLQLNPDLITIFRLCDLKSLKKSAKQSNGDVKSGGQVKGEKSKGKKVGLGDISSASQEEGGESSDEESPVEQVQDANLNDLARNAVLADSSSEDHSDQQVSPDNDLTSDDLKSKKVKKKETRGIKRKTDSKPKPALLRMKLSESDSSETENERKKTARMERLAAGSLSEGTTDSSDAQLSTSLPKKKPKASRNMVSSEEEEEEEESNESEADEPSDNDSDSDFGPKKRSRKARASSSSDSESEDRPKKKRKRIRGGRSDESDDNNDKEEASPNKRHEIRKIMKDKNLSLSTKEAAAEERERRKRLEERQALYNKTFAIAADENKSEDSAATQLVLDFDPETKEVLVEVNKKLVKKLKPHQLKGIKFMWDACFESLAQIQSEKIPGGAILAHCMGLGKTLQTVTLTHTVLENKRTGVQRVMVICPVNTVKNWQDEYDKWLTGDLELDVYEMSKEKDNWGRADRISQWFREGGILIIGYEMFRNLVNEKNGKFKKNQREIFNR